MQYFSLEKKNTKRKCKNKKHRSNLRFKLFFLYSWIKDLILNFTYEQLYWNLVEVEFEFFIIYRYTHIRKLFFIVVFNLSSSLCCEFLDKEQDGQVNGWLVRNSWSHARLLVLVPAFAVLGCFLSTKVLVLLLAFGFGVLIVLMMEVKLVIPAPGPYCVCALLLLLMLIEFGRWEAEDVDWWFKFQTDRLCKSIRLLRTSVGISCGFRSSMLVSFLSAMFWSQCWCLRIGLSK